MAGHASNWFKTGGGGSKGRVFVSNAMLAKTFGGIGDVPTIKEYLGSFTSLGNTGIGKLVTGAAAKSAQPTGQALPKVAPPPPPAKATKPKTSKPKTTKPKVAPAVTTSPGLDAPLVSFDKSPTTGQVINGIPLTTGKVDAYATTPDVDVGEPPFTGKPGKKRSAGILMIEPDGRVWVVAPSNEYGGYKNTFPKGTLEKEYTAQQNALKEAYEEAGLNAEITGFLGDFEGDTSVTRYYLGKRTGGSPADAHYESSHVRLATPDELESLLNKTRDKKILAALKQALSGEKTGTPSPTPTPAPKARQKPAQTATAGFPTNPLDLPAVQSLGGSTGAKLVQGPDGAQYVRKKGANSSHLREEGYADAAYRALGVAVPDFQITETPSGPVKLSTFLAGAKGIKSFLDGTSDASSAIRKQLRAGFAADALMGNWDAIGLAYDNVLVKDGVAYRVDNGGSLRYRAQGNLKGTDGTPPFTEFPIDVWGLRDGTNPKAKQMIQAFNKVTIYDVAQQVRGILKRQAAFLAALPADLRPLMVKRLANMRYIADVADVLQQQGANSSKADSYLKKLMIAASEGGSLPSVADAIAGYQETWG